MHLKWNIWNCVKCLHVLWMEQMELLLFQKHLVNNRIVFCILHFVFFRNIRLIILLVLDIWRVLGGNFFLYILNNHCTESSNIKTDQHIIYVFVGMVIGLGMLLSSKRWLFYLIWKCKRPPFMLVVINKDWRLIILGRADWLKVIIIIIVILY